jgi:ribosome-binding factor A
MNERTQKRAQGLMELAAEFLARESNRTSLITITRAELNDTHDHIVFFVHIFPEDMRDTALGFLLRKRGECRDYMKKHARIGRMPHVEFALDKGEDHRIAISKHFQ